MIYKDIYFNVYYRVFEIHILYELKMNTNILVYHSFFNNGKKF